VFEVPLAIALSRAQTSTEVHTELGQHAGHATGPASIGTQNHNVCFCCLHKLASSNVIVGRGVLSGLGSLDALIRVPETFRLVRQGGGGLSFARLRPRRAGPPSHAFFHVGPPAKRVGSHDLFRISVDTELRKYRAQHVVREPLPENHRAI
jgi:hypothetical protein